MDHQPVAPVSLLVKTRCEGCHGHVRRPSDSRWDDFERTRFPPPRVPRTSGDNSEKSDGTPVRNTIARRPRIRWSTGSLAGYAFAVTPGTLRTIPRSLIAYSDSPPSPRTGPLQVHSADRSTILSLPLAGRRKTVLRCLVACFYAFEAKTK